MPPGSFTQDVTTLSKSVLKLDIEKDQEREKGRKSKFGELVSCFTLGTDILLINI